MAEPQEAIRRRLPDVPVEKIVHVPHHQDPMREGQVFVLKNHAYQVTHDKTRGRHTIRHFGLVQ